jgi:hypothetical protein
MRKQPHYAWNKECKLWPSYEGENDWRICQLIPATEDNKKGAQDSIKCMLMAKEARMSLMIWEDQVGAVGTTDKAAIGYYIVKWLSKPYALQADTQGMSDVIGAGAMVADTLYFNRVERAPYWYTQSGEAMVIEVRYVLQSELQLEKISALNTLPLACSRLEAMQRKAVRVSLFDHETIMEEAEKQDRLEYNEEDESKDNKLESKQDGESDSEGCLDV